MSASAATSTETTVAAGTVVHLRSGLTMTVPTGWTATVTRSDGTTHVEGAFGGADASELLVLTEIAGGRGVRVSSHPGADPAMALAGRGYRPYLVSQDTTLSTAETRPPSAVAPPLGVITTHLPGAQFGVIVFGDSGSITRTSVERLWEMLKIRGASPPLNQVPGP